MSAEIQTHEPMEVRRCHTGTGSHIEPPLGWQWSELDKLRWKAGVVKADTGVTVRIQTGNLREKWFGHWRVMRGVYTMAFGSGAVGSMNYSHAWDWLNGFEAGVNTARREVKQP